MWWRYISSKIHIKNAFFSKTKKKKKQQRTARSERKIIKLSELSVHHKHKVTFTWNFSLSYRTFFFIVWYIEIFTDNKGQESKANRAKVCACMCVISTHRINTVSGISIPDYATVYIAIDWRKTTARRNVCNSIE